jgi:hypothetical protein
MIASSANAAKARQNFIDKERHAWSRGAETPPEQESWALMIIPA